MEIGKLTALEVDKQSKSLSITVKTSEQKEDNLLITFPKKLVDIVTQGGEASNFTITVNDKKVFYKETANNLVEHIFTIPFSSNMRENQNTSIR